MIGLEEQDVTGEQDLVPMRHGRMVLPFTCYRRAAKIMAADLASTQVAGLDAQLCGDGHVLHPIGGMKRAPAPGGMVARQHVGQLVRFQETLTGLTFGSGKGVMMAIGPVQLIVLGFNHPNFHGEIIEELERLHDSGTVRVIDALAVYKDANGELEAEHLSNLTEAEAIEMGSKIGALIGLGFEGEEGMEAGAAAGAQEAAAEGINVFGGAEEWDVLEDIPNDSAAALILLEHHWAVPLRDAIARAGGFRLADGFISPLDLVEIGLMGAEEAKDLHDLETSAAAGKQ
jgi:uncharacterized membrane protein